MSQKLLHLWHHSKKSASPTKNFFECRLEDLSSLLSFEQLSTTFAARITLVQSHMRSVFRHEILKHYQMQKSYNKKHVCRSTHPVPEQTFFTSENFLNCTILCQANKTGNSMPYSYDGNNLSCWKLMPAWNFVGDIVGCCTNLGWFIAKKLSITHPTCFFSVI